jgi:DtxR family manganese transport transcriptional regulator
MSVRDAAAESVRHQTTREHHRRERAEDYVELISDLQLERGDARLTDIADRLGVSHVTASKTLKRLEREGWVTCPAYRPILLTQSGEKLAQDSRERHRVVLAFLLNLGVSAAQAEIDAEGIEHHVSQETLEAIRRAL